MRVLVFVGVGIHSASVTVPFTVISNLTHVQSIHGQTDHTSVQSCPVTLVHSHFNLKLVQTRLASRSVDAMVSSFSFTL